MSFSYTFPAVKGIQANREYYITMVPMKLLPKLFPNEDEIVLPEYRAQRKINESRIPEIRDYMLENRDSYVFSALSASIDGNFSFCELGSDGIGTLSIPMDSTFLINDGQHRKAAIEAAMIEDESIGEESISIVFFKDNGLAQSQQMFTDLNKHAVKTSNSLANLYDSRDSVAVVTRNVIEAVPFFKKYTDKEKDNLGKNSLNLFTLNNIYKANQKVIHKEICGDLEEKFLIKYWNLVANNIDEWQDVMSKNLTKKDLREGYILTLAVTLNAFGRLGRYFYDNPKVEQEEYLSKLAKIDWLRSNSDCWEGRTIRENGKIINTEEASILTCIKIKQLIGLELTKEEEFKEKQFVERK